MALSPNKDEKEGEFVNRCVDSFTKEGRPEKMAFAICTSIWNRSQRKDDSSGVIETGTERTLGYPTLD